MATHTWGNIPGSWLLHFARVMKPSIVRHLVLACKHYRKNLTRNSVWLVKCEKLDDFHKLDEYERYTMIQPEGFWYEWYNDHCPRYVPLRAPLEISFKSPNCVKRIRVPSVGSISSQGSKLFVCVKIDRHPKTGRIERVIWAPVQGDLDSTFYQFYAKTKLSGTMISTLRTYGNFSTNHELCPAQWYVL